MRVGNKLIKSEVEYPTPLPIWRDGDPGFRLSREKRYRHQRLFSPGKSVVTHVAVNTVHQHCQSALQTVLICGGKFKSRGALGIR